MRPLVVAVALFCVLCTMPGHGRGADWPESQDRLADLIPSGHPCRKYFQIVFAATYRKFGEPIPLLFINQFFQESRCDSSATSKVGAAGIGQIMPKTQRDLEKKLGHEVDIRDAADNIDLALTLDYQYRKLWKPEARSYCDRLWLMLGGYNGGPGYWINAQKVCTEKTGGTCNGFTDMAPFYPDVNASGAKENLGYPTIISTHWAKMQPTGGCDPVLATKYLR